MVLASELLVWLQLLALAQTDARLWEHKRLRLRLLSIPARLVRALAGFGCAVAC